MPKAKNMTGYDKTKKKLVIRQNSSLSINSKKGLTDYEIEAKVKEELKKPDLKFEDMLARSR